MIDREKVIKGLEKIVEFFKARSDMAVGDGKMLLLSWMRAAEDAITLLCDIEDGSLCHTMAGEDDSENRPR